MKKLLKKQFTKMLSESVDYRRQVEADERRKNKEWELGPNCPEEGLKAHALYNWLISEGDISEYSEEDRKKTEELQREIEKLNREYDEKEDTDTSILDKIEELEDELDSIEKYDVYSIIPDGEYYDLSAFVVAKPDLEDRRYTVGDDDDMTSSGQDAVRESLEELGYDGFNKSFVNSHIDEDKVYSYAHDYYSDDVYNNPEAWLSDSQRNLSRKQEDEIKILNMRIQRAEEQIEKLEEYESEGYELRKKIESLESLIDDYESEIEDIEENPDGDFPDELIEGKVDELAQEAADDSEYFINDNGLDISDFIDEDAFIDDVLDADGPAHFLNRYDGNYESVRIGDKQYDIMRID